MSNSDDRRVADAVLEEEYVEQLQWTHPPRLTSFQERQADRQNFRVGVLLV